MGVDLGVDMAWDEKPILSLRVKEEDGSLRITPSFLAPCSAVKSFPFPDSPLTTLLRRSRVPFQDTSRVTVLGHVASHGTGSDPRHELLLVASMVTRTSPSTSTSTS